MMAVNLHLDVVTSFVSELAKLDVRDVCISPGSRSTPLTMAFARHGGFKTWLLLDERSAAYFALGLARSHRKPVVLVCTSGTAAANYMPGVVEARFSRIPLIVITSDRPGELRGVGANQTIDQIGLYGSHVKWSVEMPIPDGTPELMGHARATAARAVGMTLTSPEGPIHLNWPFREPLLPPVSTDAQNARRHTASVKWEVARRQFTVPELATLAATLQGAGRGMLVAGPQFDTALVRPLLQLASKLKFIVLADPLSQLRAVNEGLDVTYVIDRYDTLLRQKDLLQGELWKQLKPDVVIRLGQAPTSKVLGTYLAKIADVRQIVIDDSDDWRDPQFSATDVWQADPALLLNTLVGLVSERVLSDYVRGWITLNRRIDERQSEVATVIESQCQQEYVHSGDENVNFSGLFEGRIFLELADLLPRNATLFVGNSMPVRDLDSFFPKINKPLRIFANRGASGIDGVVSSALGVSAAYEEPTILVIGDISFYHDLNGLLAAKQYALNLTIILVHNDGGGIFSFLPQATQTDVFSYFETPHGLAFQSVVEMYGGVHQVVSDWQTFRGFVSAAMHEGGLRVIELRTDRDANAHMHHRIFDACRNVIV